jgi:hypothetical protein
MFFSYIQLLNLTELKVLTPDRSQCISLIDHITIKLSIKLYGYPYALI